MATWERRIQDKIRAMDCHGEIERAMTVRKQLRWFYVHYKETKADILRERKAYWKIWDSYSAEVKIAALEILTRINDNESRKSA